MAQQTPAQTDVQSLGGIIRRSCTQYPTKAALILPTKPSRTTITYADLWMRIRFFALGLQQMNLQRGDKICIFSENSWEWSVMDWAGQCLGLVVVPIYPTLPGDQAAYIVNDCGAKAVFAGSDKLRKLLDGLTNASRHILEEFAQSVDGKPIDEAELNTLIDGAKQEDVATIIYTSGTTGNPKGAVLPHRCFVGLCANIKAALPVDDRDVWVSFLPLSHVFERYGGHVFPMSVGATVGFSSGAVTLGNDLRDIRPTLMMCVPRLLESIMEKIVDSVRKQSPTKQFLFNLARSQGQKRFHKQFAPLYGVLDRVVLEKVRERTGGRLRFFVSGGGALPHHVAEFYGSLGIQILQGYGLTETTAATSINHPDNNRPETVGEALPGLEMKIAADGEILIRGYSVMDGYYNLPAATAEAIDAEGWFHTGDIGVQEGMFFRITDRKKDLLVLGNGKNVAPQPIENKIRESRYIQEVALFGDGQAYVAALIIPSEDHIKEFAHEAGVTSSDFAGLCALPAIRDLIEKELKRVNQTSADFERVKRFEIISTPFSIEGGELTPSLKVKRKVVREKYRALIDGMFK